MYKFRGLSSQNNFLESISVTTLTAEKDTVLSVEHSRLIQAQQDITVKIAEYDKKEKHMKTKMQEASLVYDRKVKELKDKTVKIIAREIEMSTY